MSHRKSLVTDMMEAVWNRRDLSALQTYYRDDYVNHTVPPGRPADRAGVGAVVEMLTAAFPDQHYVIDHLVEEDDHVVVRCHHQGTHTGNFLGHEPTSRPFSMLEIHIFRFEGDMIVEHWGLHDDAGLLRQLGLAADGFRPGPPDD